MIGKVTRHIPAADIRQFDDISFENALRDSLCGSDDYDASQWLFVPNTYTEYRYILGTRGNDPLICIGINPSTARPNMLDPTLKSVERIAKVNGFDSFLMFNVSAQRVTLPDDMDLNLNEVLHAENLKAFEYLLKLTAHPRVWAAWGTIITKRPYLMRCLADMAALAKAYDTVWLCAGKCSKAGHPHHPLYLRKDEQLRPFDMECYLEQTAGSPSL